MTFTTINTLGKEVFTKETNLTTIITFGIKNGIDKMEKVIKNTYTKEDSNTIINALNALI